MTAKLMQPLNLPISKLKFLTKNEQNFIFDIIRKKYVALTNEEWVRQNFIHFLIFHKNFPLQLMNVEKAFKVNNLTKRSDILVFDKNKQHLLVVECKAPEININQSVLEQVLRYNLYLKTRYFILTNGLTHICCSINYETSSLIYLSDIPDFKDLLC